MFSLNTERANEYAQTAADEKIEQSRIASENMPKGVAGECWSCGEHSLRLVGGACAPCRDKYKLDKP
jgi:hypothetical protein